MSDTATAPQGAPEPTVHLMHGGQTIRVPMSEYKATMDKLVAMHGDWIPGVSQVYIVTDGGAPVTAPTQAPQPVTQGAPSYDPALLPALIPAPTQAPRSASQGAPLTQRTPASDCAVSADYTPAPVFSDFGAGRQVIDQGAVDRITAQRAVLGAHGVTVNESEQFYATGTRMAKSGYQAQAERKAEHDNMRGLVETCDELTERIIGEKRRNREITAGDFAQGLSINGALTFDGYKLQPQAIRGLLGRLDSPAAGFVFGVRDRLATTPKDTDAGAAMRALDKSIILDTVKRECLRNPGKIFNLRMRDANGDIFATVSPSYGVADAPLVMPDVKAALAGFPGVKATFNYNPSTTAWEIRAQVHTPTPTMQQAVGEAYQGFASVRGWDNGTGRLGGGGGIWIIRCLNASIFAAGESEISRRHRGNVLVNLGALVAKSVENIAALIDAWGVARQDVIALPADDAGKLIPITEAIPGFYRYMLQEKRGDLIGVLPGSTVKHAAALAMVYDTERRDPSNVTRADLAQGFTRYIQTLPADTQRGAESGIGSWLVNGGKVAYAAA